MPEEKGIMYELLNVDADKASKKSLRFGEAFARPDA